MSAHTIPVLWSMWQKGEVSAEQAIGYMLQNLLALFQWRAEVENGCAS